MEVAAFPDNENERLNSLLSYGILDSLPEDDYDEITSIAAQICGTPISLISLIDGERQWFKSSVGMVAKETPREIAFCAHAILNPHEIFIIEDTLKDNRFADNPLVIGNPDIRFYAGAPLVTEDGYSLGTLCVIDQLPRVLNEGQLNALKSLSKHVISLIKLRKRIQEMEVREVELIEKADETARFAHLVSHDLKSPLRAIANLADIISDESEGKMNEDGLNAISMLKQKVLHASNLVEGILQHTIAGRKSNQPEIIDLLKFVEEVVAFCSPPNDIHVLTDIQVAEAFLDPILLHQVLQNLVSNAIKYNDKNEGVININIFKRNQELVIEVVDNGPGIPKNEQTKIFNMLSILAPKDRFGIRGTGIGLSTVKRIASIINAKLELESSLGEGTTFRLIIPLANLPNHD
jgi:signal transduction histidine kinase